MIEIKYIANVLLILFGLIYIVYGVGRLARFFGAIPYTLGILNIVILYLG